MVNNIQTVEKNNEITKSKNFFILIDLWLIIFKHNLFK